MSVTARAIIIDESPGHTQRHEQGAIQRIADVVRHWRAALAGAIIAGGLAAAWQVSDARERMYVVLIENAALPLESGVTPIAKHDLAAMINAMASGSTESAGFALDGTLEATVPKAGDLVRITIGVTAPDRQTSDETAQRIANLLTAAVDGAFKTRVDSAREYLDSQVEVTKQSLLQVEAMIAEDPPAGWKSDRADLVRRADELRARAAALVVRAGQLKSPQLVSAPTPQDPVGLAKRTGFVVLAAAAGAVAAGAAAAIAGKVRIALAARRSGGFVQM